ncbi:MAG: prepilin peptidase [Deltaproteobacteria bacterium]|nr:prepilin peptidase [Deltaproteobacteria bacterium]
MGPLGWIVAGMWGALWGSFFNVLIVRLPKDESIVFPASHCCRCKSPIAWFDNIPILSYFFLRGRCRVCGTHFSLRYPLVEILVCCLSLLMYWLFVIRGNSPLGLRVAQFVITSLFCGLLVGISFIDLATQLIPNVITYPGIPICVILSLFMNPTHIWDGLLGALLGYGIIWVIANGYSLLTRRQGMGMGDAKLLAMIGGLLGWQVLFPVLFLASFQGSIIGITVLYVLRKRKSTKPICSDNKEPIRPDGSDVSSECVDAQEGKKILEETPAKPSLRHLPIPFGPFLSLGAIEILLFREYLYYFVPYM